MSYRATAIIAANGQLTLPDVIREHLGVKEGDRLDFDLADSGELTVTPSGIKPPVIPFDRQIISG